MSYDILIDPINTVFAINCREEGSALHCGALYLEPLIQHQSIRLAYGEASIQVELPFELLQQSTPYVGWNVELPISHEQVRQPPFLTR